MDRQSHFNRNNWSYLDTADHNPYTVGQGHPSEQRTWVQNTYGWVVPGAVQYSRAYESVNLNEFAPDPGMGTPNGVPSPSAAAVAFSGPAERAYGYPQQRSQNTFDYPLQNHTYASNSVYGDSYDTQQMMCASNVYCNLCDMVPENRRYGEPWNPQLQHTQMAGALQQPSQIVSETITWETHPPSVALELNGHRAPYTDFGNQHNPPDHVPLLLQSTAATATTAAALSGPTEHGYQQSSAAVASEFDILECKIMLKDVIDNIDMFNENGKTGCGFSDTTSENERRRPQRDDNTNYGGTYDVPPSWYRNIFGDSYDTIINGHDRQPSRHRNAAMKADESSRKSQRIDGDARTTLAGALVRASAKNMIGGGDSGSSGRDNRSRTGARALDVGLSPNATVFPTGTEPAPCPPPVNDRKTGNLDLAVPKVIAANGIIENPPSKVIVADSIIGKPPQTAGHANSLPPPARRHITADRGETSSSSAKPVAGTSAAPPRVSSAIEKTELQGAMKASANGITDHQQQPEEEPPHGSKRHRCDICGQCFSYPHESMMHRKTHTNIRLYTCDKCGKSFAQLMLLESHGFIKHSKSK